MMAHPDLMTMTMMTMTMMTTMMVWHVDTFMHMYEKVWDYDAFTHDKLWSDHPCASS